MELEGEEGRKGGEAYSLTFSMGMGDEDLRKCVVGSVLTSNPIATSDFMLIQPGYGIANSLKHPDSPYVTVFSQTLIQFLGFQHRDIIAVSTQNLIVVSSHLIYWSKKCNIWYYASKDEGGRTYNHTHYPRSHEFILYAVCCGTRTLEAIRKCESYLRRMTFLPSLLCTLINYVIARFRTCD